MRAAIHLGIGLLLAAAIPGLQAQVSPSTPGNVKTALSNAGQSAPPAAKPAAPPPAKPTAQTTKPAAKPGTKPAAKPMAKPAAKPAVKKAETTTTASAAPPAESEAKQARRDPFESLIGRQQAQSAANKNLPPGKAGLQVSTLRLDGIVKASNGMIAVVSNPQLRTYFLREGDHLYDGTVEKISMDGVSFHEEGKDAFGQPVERQVNKRIYPSAGEQQ
jgi:Tfp pilus assembly protein PilP